MNLDACAWWHMWLNMSDIVLPQPDLKPVVIRSVNQMVAEGTARCKSTAPSSTAMSNAAGLPERI